MPLPFKDDEVYPPDLGWTTTHALYDRQQSNRSRTTDFNLDRYAQGCKETTTIMCENGVWIKQNKLCCAVPRTNHTVIPTMGRRKFAVAIWMCSGESPGSPSANQYLQSRDKYRGLRHSAASKNWTSTATFVLVSLIELNRATYYSIIRYRYTYVFYDFDYTFAIIIFMLRL